MKTPEILQPRVFVKKFMCLPLIVGEVILWVKQQEASSASIGRQRISKELSEVGTLISLLKNSGKGAVRIALAGRCETIMGPDEILRRHGRIKEGIVVEPVRTRSATVRRKVSYLEAQCPEGFEVLHKYLSYLSSFLTGGFVCVAVICKAETVAL